MNKQGRLLHALPAIACTMVLAGLTGCGGGGGSGGVSVPATALVETPTAVLELKQEASCESSTQNIFLIQASNDWW